MNVERGNAAEYSPSVIWRELKHSAEYNTTWL